MSFADASLTALRVFRAVAEQGTLTAAAARLGYTQSAVSRQIASLERAAGTRLLQRRHDGVRRPRSAHPTPRHPRCTCRPSPSAVSASRCRPATRWPRARSSTSPI